MNIGNNLNINNNQLLNTLLQNLASDPTGIESKVYYNTTSKKVRFYNGTAWADIGSAGTGDVVGPASAVDSQVALFDTTTGKLIKASTLTATVVKAASGVLSAAVAGTDYLAPAAIGTTVQAYDATLDSLAAYNTNGILTQTASNTFTGRTITGTANEITVTDGNGVAANPTLSLPSALTFTGKTITGGTFTTPTLNINDDSFSVRDNGDTSKVLQFQLSGITTATTRTLTIPNASGTIALLADLTSGYQPLDATLTALAGLNTTAGVVVQTGTDTFTKRTLTGTSNRIVITNGDGVSGNPTFDIGTDVVTATSTHSFTNKTFDANGTGNSITNIETADFATNVIDNDATLAANSSTRIATQQAVKGYVDNAIAGVDWKDSVRVATTATGTLATAYENGDTVDGIVLATNDRILIKNQSTQTENGIYVVQASGAPVRATDADIGAEILAAGVYVRQGSTNAGSNWVNNNTTAITIGSTNITFAQFQGQVQPDATTTSKGIVELATQAEAEAKSLGTVVLTPSSIINFTQKKTFTIGDGSTTSFPLTHNLNSQDIAVSIRKVSTNEQWLTDITCNTVNQATLVFTVAPTSNEFVVTIIG